MKCYACKCEKSQEYFCKSKGKYRTLCKSCHTSQENDRRKNRTVVQNEEYKQKQKLYYDKKALQRKNGEMSIDEQIKLWATKVRYRKEGKRFNGRREIPIDFLYQLAKTALKKYPYMVFNSVGYAGDRASLDKIDPTKDYENLDNLSVIPLWLNSAKIDYPLDIFNQRIKHYKKNK